MFNIKLKRDGKENLYIQIYEAIRAEILADKYTPDTKMPSIRKLASRLNVNTETVVKAYDLLAVENLIYKKEGSGSYIAPAAALKSNSDDHRLRILSSKKFSAPSKIIDFSGAENTGEFLEEYSWDLIFDRFYSEFKGNVFSSIASDNSYFKFLQDQYSDLNKNKLFYSSETGLRDIMSEIVRGKKEFLFTRENNISVFNNFFNLASMGSEKNNFQIGFDSEAELNFYLSPSDYESLMDYLEENKIDYLFISDESTADGVLDWSLSKLKSLLELARMLKFKLIIFEYFGFYQQNPKIKELLDSKFADQIILIQGLTERVFPGLKMGLVYLKEKDLSRDKGLKIIDKYSLTKYLSQNSFSAGDNLVYNLLSYYLNNGYLKKRLKLLKQRLKNKKLLLAENVKEHFRGVQAVENNSLFYLKLVLNQSINQHDFKVFAEKNSILLPLYWNFAARDESSQLIISPATLNQFSIKQGVMALAKVYWQFIS
ncbi:GntR family transcriptional regulator [Halanaerobium sp. ST460_2HS_T2]|uniref:GntR family transcriptional regulator n=1 Tax=Halanaerobium sp. ST460_2HS_T2 TaxID=2183914 RepID=UPI000DF2E27A|nr:winged helix-turn-helix domain-containing protein [Halanaerobium sp. ST460_2HS_T2]RCW52239.1 DNA-binding transcriptional MocR family regulator [Halanaerobium sp. ST460_2HS_T2]